MEIQDLPALNASLNAASATAVFFGVVAIKKGQIKAHKVCMLLGVSLSAAFLVSYVTYHLNAEATRFEGEGFIRGAYFLMLITHIILAVVVVPLVLTTVILALRNRLSGHKRLARWTLPIWLYVSVTGVLIYFSLYGLPGWWN